MSTLLAYAKINLFLEVVGKRPDNYHDIDSVFLEIDLADTLSAEETDSGQIALVCDRPDIPTGDDNLIVKAANLLKNECGVRGGIRFSLTKRIPMGTGLGGGSSNAAAALRLANRIWGANLSDGELAELGARIGSDIPFFLTGGVCRCRGRGEIVAPLPPFPPDVAVTLALPPIYSGTAAAYQGLRLPEPGKARTPDRFIAAMQTGDVEGMRAEAFNRFEPTVFAAFPELGRMHASLEARLSRPVRLTGSGSGLWCFGETQSCPEDGTFFLTTRSVRG